MLQRSKPHKKKHLGLKNLKTTKHTNINPLGVMMSGAVCNKSQCPTSRAAWVVFMSANFRGKLYKHVQTLMTLTDTRATQKLHSCICHHCSLLCSCSIFACNQSWNQTYTVSDPLSPHPHVHGTQLPHHLTPTDPCLSEASVRKFIFLDVYLNLCVKTIQPNKPGIFINIL